MAKHHRTKTRSAKKILVPVIITVAVAAAAVGGYFLLKEFTGKTINVYPVENLSTDYTWADEAQTDGRVTTDKIQSVYISETQQITEMYVEEGQSVTVGDPILAFDTTLSQLELDRQSIRVAQLELDIQDAEKKLAEIDTYKVGTPPVYDPPAFDYSDSLIFPETLPVRQKGIGTAEDPMVYLWNDNCTYDNLFIAELVALSEELKAQQTPPATPEPEITPEPSPDIETSPAPEASPDVEPSPVPDTSPAPEITPEPELPPEPEDPYVYVVFEVRDSDAINGTVLRAWEMAILMNEDGSWVFQMVEPVYEPNEDASSGYVPEVWVDNSIYYSASEIAQMKAECKQKIIDLNLQLKMAKLEYQRLEHELSSGIVYATVDGVVKTVREPDVALAENQPLVLVSGGGGYYITAALSEMELPYMNVGDTVSIESWENYTTLEATITEISEYPDETGRYWHYSEGNQNVSLYPFSVFVNEDANLREGEWVTVRYTPGGGDSEGLYVEVPFIREENGKSYVFVDVDGRLEKRYLATGGNLWGSYIKVLSGLTKEDHIAFPYGRGVEDGAKTRIAEMDELYSY